MTLPSPTSPSCCETGLEGKPGGTPSFSWPPRPPTPSPASPGLPFFPGLSCPAPAVSPENPICAQDPKTSPGHVSQVRASAWPPVKSSLTDPATCPTWSHGVPSGHTLAAEADDRFPHPLLPPPQQLCPPGLPPQVAQPSPGGPWFLPHLALQLLLTVALPPPSLRPQSLLTTHQPPWSSC